jgi:hypothetical protein
MFLLELRYRVRNLTSADIPGQLQVCWQRLCRTRTILRTCKDVLQHTKEQLARPLPGETLRALWQDLANGDRQQALEKARCTLERLIFVEERPSQQASGPGLTTGLLLHRIPFAICRVARHWLHRLKTSGQHMRATTTACQISLLLVALFVVSGLLAQTLHTMQHLSISSVSRLIPSEISIRAHQIPAVNASQALTRISQLDESEYSSQTEYSTWAYSACSTASITEVLNAYGYRYRISDVLQVESRLGEITPQLGLLENVGIANTAAHFGFQTDWGTHWTLEQVIKLANLGRPVIVSWPPQRYDGGHIVVVTGGDAGSIYLADSSRWNRRVLSHAQFLQWWDGFAAVLIPAAH